MRIGEAVVWLESKATNFFTLTLDHALLVQYQITPVQSTPSTFLASPGGDFNGLTSFGASPPAPLRPNHQYSRKKELRTSRRDSKSLTACCATKFLAAW